MDFPTQILTISFLKKVPISLSGGTHWCRPTTTKRSKQRILRRYQWSPLLRDDDTCHCSAAATPLGRGALEHGIHLGCWFRFLGSKERLHGMKPKDAVRRSCHELPICGAAIFFLAHFGSSRLMLRNIMCRGNRKTFATLFPAVRLFANKPQLVLETYVLAMMWAGNSAQHA